MASTPSHLMQMNLSQGQYVEDLLNYAVSHHQRGRFIEADLLYMKARMVEPNNHVALQLSGVLAAQTGENVLSLNLLSRAISLKPDYVDALSNRGNVLQQLGRSAEALQDYDKAISLKPDYIDALYNRGIALKELRRLEDAIADYDKAISLKPDHVGALNNRGNALQGLGRFDEALQDFDKAIALKPHHIKALNSRGLALHKLKRFDEALEDYNKAISLKPDFLEAFINRGTVLQELRRFDEALNDYDKAISLKPSHIIVYINRGVIYKELRRFDDAIADYNKAISLKPDYVDAFSNRGNALQELRRFDEALTDYNKAISLKPDYAEAYNNRGAALKELARYTDALQDYDKAISLKPDYVDALSNRGNALQEMGRFEEASIDFDRAIALKPDHASAHWNKSLQLLRQGKFTSGWKLYEWRWKRKELTSPRREFSQPLWLGKEDLNGKTILLHWEQGFGDTIQFSRYAKEIAKFGCKTILEVQKPLFELMKSIEGVDELIASGTDLPQFDFYCPLMSLPLAMGTTLETIPSGKPYLKSADDKLSRWSERLGPKSKPRVGLVWCGNANHTNDHNRSIALEQMLGAAPEGYELISLQKEVRKTDLTTLEQSKQLRHFGADLNDFTDTAALCELMDVIISVDTSVAHLAGALGKSANLLLPYNSDFRWLVDRSDSPWYPSMKLFKQGPDMLWKPVLEKIKADLKILKPISQAVEEKIKRSAPAELA